MTYFKKILNLFVILTSHFLINTIIKPKILGKSGETLAAKYLHAQNYDPVCTNYHCRFGEIDIIALDKNVKPCQLVFVEVKTRTDLQFGTPQESITFSKKQKLIKTALHFLNQSSAKIATSWRMDLIAIILNQEGKLQKLQHFKNILNG